MVVDKTQGHSRPDLFGTALNRRTESGRVTLSAGTADKNKEVLGIAHPETLCCLK